MGGFTLEGAFEGEWVHIGSEGELHVFDWNEETTFVGLHGLERDSESYFDLGTSGVGPSPRLTVSPASAAHRPLTLYLPEGEWRALFFATQPARMNHVAVREGSGGQTFDVDLLYAVREPGDAEVLEAIERMRVIYRAAGFRVGEVREHRLPDEVRDRFVTIDRGLESQDLRDLFAETVRLNQPSVPVFLVETLGGSAGVTGSTPGTWGLFGEGATGVAVALGEQSEMDLGVVLSHEVGHYLGLAHTSERDGTVVEGISDTLECRRTLDVSGDGTVSAEECPEGAMNLMHWSPVGTALSAGQREQLSRCALMY